MQFLSASQNRESQSSRCPSLKPLTLNAAHFLFASVISPDLLGPGSHLSVSLWTHGWIGVCIDLGREALASCVWASQACTRAHSLTLISFLLCCFGSDGTWFLIADPLTHRHSRHRLWNFEFSCMKYLKFSISVLIGSK